MYTINPELEKKEIIRRYRNLLKAWRPNTDKKDTRLIRKAFNIAVDAHKDMRRKTGEPYIYHPLEVSKIVAGEIGLGTTSVICSLLHDVVEDSDYTLADISNMFGETVAKIIDGLTKIDEIFNQNTPSIQAENFRKMLLTLSDDVRVILIKLADRLHNMRTLDAMPVEKQLKIASETSFLYAPLAHRLGLYSIKSELEDLALKYTEPEIYKTISQKLKETEKGRNRFINKFIYPIKKGLEIHGMKYQIVARTKSIASIWNKMLKKEIPFEEVYDLFAVRIIVDSTLETEKVDCWKVYSIVTDHYRPNVDRIRDWISIPKGNGYEALHATVMSHTGKWVEVQVRSKRMNEIAEKGYAAHWKYKDPASNTESGVEEWLAKIREVLQGPESSALEFLSDFKLNLFSDEIYLFTPKGETKTMPAKSTALDFAYNIHSQIGNRCIGAKVNHKLVPLNYQLKSGDQVEIITSKKQTPKAEWYNFVVTAKAKSEIKSAIKEERKLFARKGKKMLEAYFKLSNINYTNENLKIFQAFTNTSSLTELHYFIAIDKFGLEDLKTCFLGNEKPNLLNYLKRPFVKTKQAEGESKLSQFIDSLKNKPEASLLKDTIKNIKYRLANCCNPIPGDAVVGIITNNDTIDIHRINCPEANQLMSKYGHRIVKAKWTNQESIAFLAGVKISGIDKKGLINNITRIISEEHNLNIRSFHMETTEGTFEGVIMLYVNDTEHLNQLIENLKRISGVQKASRINSLNEVFTP